MSDEIETIDRNPKSWAAWKGEAERLQKIIDDMAGKDSEPVVYASEETPATDAFLAEVRHSAIKTALDDCSEYLDRDCIMDSNGISYEDAALREAGAMALQNALLHKGGAK